MGAKMKLKKQLKLQKDIEVPWYVWTKVGENAKFISVHGDQASLTNTADYGNVQELRAALAWYVDQLGGNIKWKKE
jgi:hypothetical protein